jgi:mRNA-degrading endonuclease toxin of MazEF toxin-antitoxin module
MTRRADVVIARFPYAGGSGHNVRPAIVVQCDRLNRQIHNTLLAMVIGNTRLAGSEPTQFLIDPALPICGRSTSAKRSTTMWCSSRTVGPGDRL